ncbi:sigma-70 family RNA polymerase sigma factor [Paenibacillus sp. MWE-103]|uniref:Sigma-70 family RNA polymerase sigma factor n=1 Tax=Paenibacillus artemisiicola TaxID=1172618 RepID=A0ABS3WHC5_9BACL|nr:MULTISPECIES: sigma-70 family RNA polymerase sigma factor [Paenibacillus]MBO7747724.1 sigma-70 family RNA polymerase sigma factor [Paenibacillus artemisiicola]SFJ51356.1 RNA polymerase sigma factor, sigma-70 family [Paenibacillus sp. UNC496MF]
MPQEEGPAKFQALFREHYPSVLRKITLLVGDRAAAEDLTQDVFLRLYRNPPEDLDRAGAWLHRVLTRIVYDHYRKSGREANLTEKLQAMSEERSVPSNETAVIQNWEREVVRNVLNKLSERDRNALLMKEKGYSHAEIAEALQVNPKIVGTLLMRATKRLKKNLLTEEAMES